MRKIMFLCFLCFWNFHCFSQNRTIDSLNTLLKNATSDITKLDIFMALSYACEKKDNLKYAEPAWNLIDKLFTTEKKEVVRQQLMEDENSLSGLITSYYSNEDSIEWNKVLPYLNNRLLIIDKSGDQQRKAGFLFTMARISLDEKKDSSMFRMYIQKSIAVSEAIKDAALAVKGYRFMYGFYSSAANFSEALKAIQSSIAISQKLNYSKGIAQSLTRMAELYGNYGEDELAIKNYEDALDITYKIKDTAQICDILPAFGEFYKTKNNTKKAFDFFNRLLVLSNNNPNLVAHAGIAYRLIGEVNMNNGDYKNALLNFEKSLQKFEEKKDIYNITLTLHDIGLLYNKQADFEKAIAYQSRVITIVDSLGYTKQVPYFQYYLALNFYGLKKFDKAKETNEKALSNFKKYWFDVKMTSSMELLASQIDSARGDGFGAYDHYKEYVLLTEKIRGEEIRKEAQRDAFKTETDKQKDEQDKKDAIAKRTQNLQYMVIGAFLLLGIFLLYGYIQKNKDKKQIEKAYGELKSTQAQLIQSEKMASLGELTAGIAHEIQNPLNFVNNFSEVNVELIAELVDEVDKGNTEEVKAIATDIKANEEKINHHGKRADAIVKGMLQHSRTSNATKEPTDINKLADEYLRLAYHGIRAKDKSFNATLKTDFDESIGKINIIPQDIGRVLLNLITNAFYAVDEKKKNQPDLLGLKDLTGQVDFEPTVTVSTNYSPLSGKGAGGKYYITVTDNGNGIPSSIKDKIFQPFFTTKPTGQGTGLGLSLAYDIVKAHGGNIKAESENGTGSKFIIELPINPA